MACCDMFEESINITNNYRLSPMKSDRIKVYPTNELIMPDILQITFSSVGVKTTKKIVEYNYVGRNESIDIFNLGFGDYNLKSKTINDLTNSNNGDSRIVLNTVLNTIPVFFKYHPDKMIIVRGSDSRPGFKEDCNRNCSKKCGENCRKFNQRIRIYRNYIDAHFHQLNNAY